jgi:ribosome-binding ATPase
VVNTELALADLATVERRLDRTRKKAKSGEREAQREVVVLERVFALLAEGRPAREVEVTPEERPILRSFHLLTAKPVLYLANVAEGDLPDGLGNAHLDRLREVLAREEPGAEVVPVCSAIEAELSELPDEERAEFLADLGLAEPGLHRLIRGRTACWGSSPSSPPGRRRLAPGPSGTVPGRPRRRG